MTGYTPIGPSGYCGELSIDSILPPFRGHDQGFELERAERAKRGLAPAHPARAQSVGAVGSVRAMREKSLGLHLFGLAAIVFGIVTIAWRDTSVWQQVAALKPHHALLLALTFVAAAIEILGGLAIQWPRTARAGALALFFVFAIFALLCVPGIFAAPQVYNSWGNFFEQLSQAMGPLLAFALLGMNASGNNSVSERRTAPLARFAYVLFAICVISFANEQYAYLRPTVSLVPKWIPPSQMFWAMATTIAFWLAAAALLTGAIAFTGAAGAVLINKTALLAARLLTAMLVGFGLLVWFPACFKDPHALGNWTENAETFAIAGAAWIVAEYLSHQRIATKTISA
jgi:hypothetical protein